jgi:uncharacterized protein
MQLVIKVSPQSSIDKIIGFYQGMLKVSLIGVPEKGKLNEHLVNFLAKTFDIPKKSIFIKQGLTNPVKRLEISPEFDLKVELYLTRFKQAYSEDD